MYQSPDRSQSRIAACEMTVFKHITICDQYGSTPQWNAISEKVSPKLVIIHRHTFLKTTRLW